MSLPLTAVHYLSGEQNPACLKAAGVVQITGRFAILLFSAVAFVMSYVCDFGKVFGKQCRVLEDRRGRDVVYDTGMCTCLKGPSIIKQ